MKTETKKPEAPAKAGAAKEPELRTLSIATIDVSGNIRNVEEDETLGQLAGSIKALGILEPPIVVMTDFPDGKAKKPYRLIAGFRRVAAAKMAGLDTIPAIVRTLDDAEQREAQLVENLQRVDLNPVDEATAMKEYLDLKKVSAKELGARIGKSDDYVRSRVQILACPAKVIEAVRSGALTVRHAQAFARIPEDLPEVVEALEADLFRSHWIPDAERLADQAKRMVDRRREEIAKAKKIEAMKFTKCPTKGCKQPKAIGLVFGTASTLTCAAGHKWSGKTGKIPEEKQDEFERASTKRPKPKPVDREEPRTVRIPHRLEAVLVAMVKSGGIKFARVSTSYGRGSELRIRFEKGTPFGADVDFRAVDYTTGHKTQAIAQGFDSTERKKQKKAFDVWFKKALPSVAASPRVSTKTPKDGILDGSVDDVAGRVAKIHDQEMLEQIRALEVEGKARGGVFQVIDEAMAVEPRGLLEE